jgi:two-component system, NarL family, response regulator NreC
MISIPNPQVRDLRAPAIRPAPAPIRLLLVDDHAMVRAGLRELLKLENDLEVVAEAPNGEIGARLTVELKPDVVVMDLSMPVLGGAEATKQILDSDANVRILVLSAHEDAAYARAVLSSGAAGYVLKRSACDELVRAIRAVAAGDSYVDPVLAESLMPRSRRSGAFPAVSLSERELEVVRLVAKGHTAKEMADQLGLSPRTLETYKARAMAKLDLSSRADLIRYAARCGWLREP